jgi:hypothetical protein
MAQAFEIPWETGQRLTVLPRVAQGDHRRVPSNAFQIAAPGPTQRLDRQYEYGSGIVTLQAHKRSLGTTRDRPDSRLGNPGKVNRFCRF